MRTSILLACVTVSLSVACSSTSQTSGSSSSGGAEDGGVGEGGALADASTPLPGPGDFKADYKSSPDFFTNMAAPVKGTSPHGTVRTWYSSNARAVLAKDAFASVPEGTVSIKEFDMMGDGTNVGIAVMIKKPAGYDAANGDWYYDMRDRQGNVMADPPAGKVGMCIQCHSSYKATDYLAGTKVK